MIPREHFLYNINMMKKEVNTINSNKDILAKLMATENITVIHKKVPTAYFDVKSRTLCCPILKDEMSPELTDLFMGHEVGHALNTPEEGWHDAVCEKGMLFKGYLNVIEDVRIEKKIKSKYPGLRKSFYSGYKDLANQDFFGIRGRNIHEMILIDRINLYFKIGSITQIEFSKEEQPYIDRCNKLETFEEVMELATELFERQKELTENEVESMTDLEVQDMLEDLGLDDSEEGESESMTVEVSESDDSDNTQDGSNAKSEDEGQDSDESSSSTDGSENSSQEDVESSESFSKSPKGLLTDEKMKSISDEAFREKEETLYDNDDYSPEPQYLEIPGKVKYNNFIVDYKEIDSKFKRLNRQYVKNHVKEFVNSNKKIINYMVKEFEMKKAAADYKRSWSSKSGELDMSKIHQYLLKDDIFNRVQITPDGKNHGVVMLLDWSGSMHGSVEATMEQATLLSMFCRRLSIPFRLFAFSDGYYGKTDTYRSELVDKIYRADYNSKEREKLEKELRDYESSKVFGIATEKENEYPDLGKFHLLEIFNESMSNNEFNKAMENWFQISQAIENPYYYNDSDLTFDTEFGIPSGLNLGGTPLDHSLFVIRDYLKDFKEDYNIDICSLITLTDGASHRFTERNTRLVDRKINRVFDLSLRGYYNGTTHKILDWVKETTGVRTIGFYITNCKASDIAWEGKNFCGSNTDSYGDEYDKKRKEFMKLSTSFSDGCYDLAILINQKKLKLNYDEDELNVNSMDEGANKGTLKRALVKAGSNKMKQRVILNQFVEQMAV